jgi:hypothetical protein
MSPLISRVTWLALYLTTGPAWAQLELPVPSPLAKVSQRVGLTDVSLEYSSPGVKSRKIWGELVPLDKVWRTGANASTKITFSRDVTVGGQAVSAGTYSLLTIPAATAWTVILSKELGLYSGGKAYDAEDDATRFSVTPTETLLRERMTFIFNNTTDTDTSLDLEWEKLRVSIPIKVNTAAQVQGNITSVTDNAWRPHANSARYLAENTKEYDRALKYVDTSIAIQSTWYNNWIRADILAKQGKYPAARKSAQLAWDMGQKESSFFLRETVAKALEDWKGKK